MPANLFYFFIEVRLYVSYVCVCVCVYVFNYVYMYANLSIYKPHEIKKKKLQIPAPYPSFLPSFYKNKLNENKQQAFFNSSHRSIFGSSESLAIIKSSPASSRICTTTTTFFLFLYVPQRERLIDIDKTHLRSNCKLRITSAGASNLPPRTRPERTPVSCFQFQFQILSFSLSRLRQLLLPEPAEEARADDDLRNQADPEPRFLQTVQTDGQVGEDGARTRRVGSAGASDDGGDGSQDLGAHQSEYHVEAGQRLEEDHAEADALDGVEGAEPEP